MKLYILGDYLTVNAFALTGIEGRVIPPDTSLNDVQSILDEIIANPEIGLIIFNAFIHERMGTTIEDYLQLDRPLFMEIPNAGESPREEDLNRYIQQIVGIKL
ncbi:MAG: V-type ATP synthase subunit F [Candidatus Delongbacteria bacterium]|nr:V-type ATP synthase subunit F [Candidatus Delongbacteria bacterium]